MRHALSLPVIIVAVVLAGARLAPAAQTPPRTTVQEAAEGLTCQCGCGLTVANCNHPSCGFAIPMRGELAAMIRKGMGRVEILDSFRHKYGEKILSAPTTEGFNLLAWIVPYLAVGAGALLIFIAVIRWRRPEAEEAVARPSDAKSNQFDSVLRQQLERDLRRQL